MKATIYVPDELWDRAKRAGPADSNPSQLVQGALNSWIRVSEPQPFNVFDRPQEDQVFDEHIYQAQRLRREAQDLYAAGYSAGVKAAGRLSWGALEDFADVGFDVEQWVEPMRRRVVASTLDEAARAAVDRDITAVVALRPHLGRLVDPLAGPAPKGVWLKGFADALQDLYEVVMEPQRVTRSGGIRGAFETGGHILHREYGSGVIEDMRSRPSDDRLEAFVQFDSGKRRRILLDDNNDVVGVPSDSLERLKTDPQALFSELAAQKEEARKEFQSLLAKWRIPGNWRSNRARLVRLSDLVTEIPSDEKNDTGGE